MTIKPLSGQSLESQWQHDIIDKLRVMKPAHPEPAKLNARLCFLIRSSIFIVRKPQLSSSLLSTLSMPAAWSWLLSGSRKGCGSPSQRLWPAPQASPEEASVLCILCDCAVHVMSKRMLERVCICCCCTPRVWLRHAATTRPRLFIAFGIIELASTREFSVNFRCRGGAE